MTLTPIVAPDSVLCTDGMKAYGAFAEARGIEHFVIEKSIQRPATKYFAGYLQWFIARINKMRTDEVMQAL